jgi:hypothetical protein
VIRYSNYALDGPKWHGRTVRVGDAAMFVDPLFSTGVHGAISSGYMAGAALNTLLAGGVGAGDAAATYNRSCDEYFNRTRETVRLLYGFHPGTTPFWTGRAIRTMTDAEAAASLAVLGVAGAAVFLSLRDRLPMPAEFVEQLREVVIPADLEPLPAGASLRLHPHAVVQPELLFSGLGLVPGQTVRNANGYTVPLQVPSGLRQERLLLDLVNARGTDRAVTVGSEHSALFAGALVSSGNALRSDHPGQL